MSAGLSASALALGGMLVLALCTWLIATYKANVGLVDIFWSWFFVVGTLVYAGTATALTLRGGIVIALVAIWALRLSVYLAHRNWNAPEDHRYRAIRARNEPGFVWKSLYLVFGLQAVLAWVVSAPVGASIRADDAGLGWLDVLGIVIVVFGIVFQTIADGQLARFKRAPANTKRVLDTGLWRYTRHPNYFAEFCIWWGFYLLALAVGAWWTVFSPLLMTVLLLRVSGVALLEKDIGERRPGYRDYMESTNAFFPGPRKNT